MITGRSARNFHMLLPTVFQDALERGEPLTALGLLAGGGRPAGVLCGALSGESFEIRWLYIHPDFRALGGATQLLEHLTALLSAEGEISEISCDYLALGPEESGLTVFLRRYGFTFYFGELSLYGVPLSALAETPFFKNKQGGGSPLENQGSLVLSRILRCTGTPSAWETGKIDLRVSLVHFSGTEIGPFVLFTRESWGLHLAYARTGQSGDSPLVLASLLRRALRQALLYYPSDTLITIQQTSKSSEALIRRLLRDAPDSLVLSRSATLSIRPKDPLLEICL